MPILQFDISAIRDPFIHDTHISSLKQFKLSYFPKVSVHTYIYIYQIPNDLNGEGNQTATLDPKQSSSCLQECIKCFAKSFWEFMVSELIWINSQPPAIKRTLPNFNS